MSTGRRRIVAVIAAVVLLLLVGGYVLRSNRPETRCSEEDLTTVAGAAGSEKGPYLKDPRVAERFACQGYRVVADEMGSFAIADALKRPGNTYTFAFPSSTPTATRIIDERTDAVVFKTFVSPMIVVTHDAVVETLRSAGIVHEDADGNEIFDVEKYVQVALARTRWDELPGSKVRTRQVVQLKTTDPSDSNSAAMFVSIVSNVLNHRDPVSTKAQAAAVVPDLCRLLRDQGQKLTTSEDLFDYYLTSGVGGIPMALLYESHARAEAPVVSKELPADAAFLTPAPTVYSRHTFLAFEPHAEEIGRLLRDDPELRRIALEYGFRPEGTTSKFGTPTDVVEPPTYEFLDVMLKDLQRITQGDGECS